jgi:hypothetical protein
MDAVGTFFGIVMLLIISLWLLMRFGDTSFMSIIVAFILIVLAAYINIYIY